MTVPGSQEHFTEAQLHIKSVPPDWFPAEHSPSPAIVGRRPAADKYACGFCHLPNGSGRPENAKLAGLPTAYIAAQLQAFRRHDRRPDQNNWKATVLMAETVADLSDEDIAEAADYFSRQAVTSFVRVIETKTVPQHTPGFGIMMPLPGKKVPIGERIVEMPCDPERHELRDPKVTYQAYVPLGSIARGKKLAERCAACHGTGLKGDANLPGPPLAGRFPSYIFRQLYAFQSGSRTGDATLPMQGVVAGMSQSDMIALASYAGSLKP